MKIITINKNNRYFAEFVNLTYHWGDRFESYNDFKKHYLDTLNDELPKIRALIINDTVIGLYEINAKDGIDNEDYTPYLANVFVREEYRHQGFGSILINDSIKYTKELGYDSLYLHSRQENLYEKYGFKKIAEVETEHGKKRIFKYEGE
jgi:ribosomal protein S18 acetylase RimI-like enzyme